ncbi:MAG: flagellar filament capping protein FliD [Polyangiaceae bacterium]
MAIQFGGLASGLDVNSIVSSLSSIERAPADAARTRQSNVDSARTSISTFTQKLSTLQSAAAALADPVQFASFAVSSSDSAIAVSASGVATTGSFTVAVDALAREQRTYSSVQSSRSTALGLTGAMTLTLGTGSPVTVSVDAGDTLDSLATKIATSGVRVSSSVLFDGTNYRLQVRGLDTGAANAFTIDDSALGLGLGTPANTLQSASDARVRVDGITVTRSTNLLSDVIPGVSMALTKTAASVEVKTSADPTLLSQKIGAFVTAYNDIVSFGHTLAGYGSQKASNPELSGDSGIRSALSQLSSLVGSPVAGTSGTRTTLGSIGLASTQEGTIKLDSTKLQAALAADPDAVSRLFVVDPTRGSTGVMGDFKALTLRLGTGADSPFQTRIEGFRTRSRAIGDEITRLNERADAFETRLRKQFANLDKVMAAYTSQQSALTQFVSSSNSNK